MSTPDLPSGFTELEYLEGTGTQYINTGVVPAEIGDALGFSVKSYLPSEREYASASTSILGARYGSQDREVQVTAYERGMFRWGVKCYRYLGYKYVKDTLITFTLKNLEFVSTTVLNKVEERRGTVPPGHELSEYPLYLFALNARGIGCQGGHNQIYYLTISDGDELILDFVPVLDADGTPCMYDKITRKCFYNIGKGTFGYKIKATGETVDPKST